MNVKRSDNTRYQTLKQTPLLLNILENFLQTLFTPLFSDVPFSFPNVKPLIFWGSKAQFKRRSFHELNLIPIKVDPNDTSLMVHSDVELCWSDSIHFHDVQWSKILQEKLILVIYASGSVHENFGVCNKLAYNRNSHVGYSIFCHGLTQIRRVKLN